MACKYCNSPTCDAEQHPDDARRLRICRHNVQLERAFFRNRLARYEAVPARPEAVSLPKQEACDALNEWIGAPPPSPVMREIGEVLQRHGCVMVGGHIKPLNKRSW